MTPSSALVQLKECLWSNHPTLGSLLPPPPFPANMFSAPRVNVILGHVILGGPKVATDAEHDHKADVRQNGQLPTLPTFAQATLFGGLPENGEGSGTGTRDQTCCNPPRTFRIGLA